MRRIAAALALSVALSSCVWAANERVMVAVTVLAMGEECGMTAGEAKSIAAQLIAPELHRRGAGGREWMTAQMMMFAEEAEHLPISWRNCEILRRTVKEILRP